MSAAEDIDVEVKSGDVLAGKYRVEKVLGAGGMGVVVQATHIVLNDRVALKFLLPSVAQHDTTAARFLREAQAAVRIKSPHVARVVDVGTMDTGSPYMVMEYLDGKDLSQIVEQEGPQDVALAALYTLQVCEALAAAHSAGVVHRDIKPANIFLTRAADGSPSAKVLDFGISKVTTDLGVSSLTQTQVSMGSPLYMSPEQMRSARDVDARTDIWSLGVVLYEMLTGTLPFMADSMPQLCALVLENTAPPMHTTRPDIPPQLEPIVARCLEKDPAKRYQSIAELAHDLGPFAGDWGISSAQRVGRILEGTGRSRTVSHMEPPRASMVSIVQPSDPHLTATAFGTTGPQATTAVQPKERRAPLYIAIAAVSVGVLATVWGFTRASGSTASTEEVAPAAATQAAGQATAQPSEPTAEPTPPATAEPIAPSATAEPSAEPSPVASPRQPTDAERRQWAERSKPAAAPKPEEKPAPKPDVFGDRL